MFCSQIKYVREAPDKFGVDVPKLRVFEAMLLQLHRLCLAQRGGLLEAALSQDMGAAEEGANKVRGCLTLVMTVHR